MARASDPLRLRSCLRAALPDQCKAALGSACWFAGLHVSVPGHAGSMVVAILCLVVHVFWAVGSCIDGARLVAGAATAAVTVGSLMLIAKGVLGDVAAPLAAAGVVMHMSPSWSHPATLHARITR
jgi:hypothetical protein